MFSGELRRLEPSPGVLAYELNSPAFNDHALTRRFVRMPSGKRATYAADRVFDFPEGTLVAQTLAYRVDRRDPASEERLVETRVLWRKGQGWQGVSYAWNPEQTDATRSIGGKTLKVSWVEPNGSQRDHAHTVPNLNDCGRCHKLGEQLSPIGLTARQLNVARGAHSQLDEWTDAGLLEGSPPPAQRPRLPAWSNPQSGSLEARARAYLDANCSHCHNPQGPARNSGLQLRADIVEPARFGVYKTPVAAGRGSGGLRFDIVPGKPDQSILYYRICSTEAGVVMPEYGRKLVDDEGTELISRWIATMPADEGPPLADLVGEFTVLSDDARATWISEAQRFGDLARGEELLHRRDVTCLKCHAIVGTGGNVGPDLARLPSDVTPEHLVESILLPAKTIREGFATVTVSTDDGQVHSGVRLREDAQTLVLVDPVRGEIAVPIASIEERSEAGSLMPTNVASQLTKAEFRDLLRLLFELRAAPPADDPRGVRRYEVLWQPPAEFDELDPEQMAERLANDNSLIWETALVRLQGELPVHAIPATPRGTRGIVRVRFNDETPAALEFDSASGLTVASAAKPLAIDASNRVALPPGARDVTIVVDLANRSPRQIRCQMVPKKPAS